MLDSLKFVNSLLLLGAQLDAVFQMRPDKRRVMGKKYFSGNTHFPLFQSPFFFWLQISFLGKKQQSSRHFSCSACLLLFTLSHFTCIFSHYLTTIFLPFWIFPFLPLFVRCFLLVYFYYVSRALLYQTLYL